MEKISFVIVDANQNNVLKTKAVAESFQDLQFVGYANNFDDGIDCVLRFNPNIVFLEVNSDDPNSDISLLFVNELYRYLTNTPKIIITSNNNDNVLDSLKRGVYEYLLQPVTSKELRKTLARLNRDLNLNLSLISNDNQDIVASFLSKMLTVEEPEIHSIQPEIHSIQEVSEKEVDSIIDEEIRIDENFQNHNQVENLIDEVPIEDIESNESSAIVSNNNEVFFPRQSSPEKPLVICVKSYGDYRYIDAKNIAYLQADNNSTDIHLNNGEMITAFKTLKHFEGVLKHPFARIHNSYIVNIDYVSRIHTGNAVCHIKDSSTKLPFSKSYKDNVDAIITTIASGNYIEI